MEQDKFDDHLEKIKAASIAAWEEAKVVVGDRIISPKWQRDEILLAIQVRINQLKGRQ